MIEFRELTKRYGGVTAVDGLSFTVQPGQITGFLGPNGAGKSTALRILLGLDRPDRGTATIDGAPYRSLRRPLCRVGSLLDARAVHGGRSGYHHLLWLAQSNGLGRPRVLAVLDAVGLTEAARRPVRKYSLGMAQRLGVAAALLGDPGVVILDEPANGLDTEGIRWLRGLLRRLAAEGRTVLLSSHVMSEMELVAQRVVVIGRGRLLADAPLTELTGQSTLEDTYVRLTEAATQYRGGGR